MTKRSVMENELPANADMISPGDIEKMWAGISSRMERVDMERAKENVWLRRRSGRRQHVFFLCMCGGFFDVQLNSSHIACFADEE